MVARAVEHVRRLLHRVLGEDSRPGMQLSRAERSIVFCYDLGMHGLAQLRRDNAPQMAAALAYRTLFSLVPVMVIGLVMAKAFYGEEGIRFALDKAMEFAGLDQIQLERHSRSGRGVDGTQSPAELAPLHDKPALPSEFPGKSSPGAPPPQTQPTTPTAPASAGSNDSKIALSQELEKFVDRSVTRMTSLNYSAITIVSIGVFIYAAISLLVQIEQAFNTICQAPRGRRLVWRIIIYWSVLTLGSVGIAASFAIGRSWSTLLESLPNWLSSLGTIISVLGRVGVTWLLLVFVYCRMPNAQVRVKTAAIGALVAAVAWESAKTFFVYFIKMTSEGQHAIYGSLALLPILLFWLYITWHIVLIGLEIAWTLQTLGEARTLYRPGARRQQITFADPTAGVAIMQHLAAAFAKGESPGSDPLSKSTGLPLALVQMLLDKLISAGLVHRVDRGGERDSYTLARPPQSIGADEVVSAALQLTPAASGTATSDASVEALRKRWVESLQGVRVSG